MDDDSCVMKLIEIVPVDDYINRLESSGVKLSPCHVKVCMLFILCLFIVNYMICLSVVNLLNSRKSHSRLWSANLGTRTRLDLDRVSTRASQSHNIISGG